jgi:hypothetical protein
LPGYKRAFGDSRPAIPAVAAGLREFGASRSPLQIAQQLPPFRLKRASQTNNKTTASAQASAGPGPAGPAEELRISEAKLFSVRYPVLAVAGWNFSISRMVTRLRAPAVLLSICLLMPARVPATAPRTSAGASPTPPVIVVGFLGGFIKHDNPVHSEVQLAARLQQQYPAGVHVETFESYRGEKARQKILELLDTDHDGSLSTAEKQCARIILYGHSWGASEAIALARQLKKDGIHVLLTVQVDSVNKVGQNDEVIPANVAQAANFYQPNGMLHGEREIRAADPERTRIIGNFRFDYRSSRYRCHEYPWFDRVLMKQHTQIECDPKVWAQVESLIRSNIIPEGPN